MRSHRVLSVRLPMRANSIHTLCREALAYSRIVLLGRVFAVPRFQRLPSMVIGRSFMIGFGLGVSGPCFEGAFGVSFVFTSLH